jgi:biopolymer transport protein ExbD
MQIGSGSTLKSEINVTPLVDVVLVLLIIFMVITPILQMGYAVNVPPKVESFVPPPVSDQIIVRLDAEGRMYINKDVFAPELFGARLKEALHNRESKIVFFAADGELTYDKVADFMNLVRDSGAQNLGIVFDDMRQSGPAAGSL